MATREIVCWSMADHPAQLMTGEEVGVQALNLLRQALWQMGRTPTHRTRIERLEETSDDPAE